MKVFFELLGNHPIVFVLLAMAIGYPLGRISLRGIVLGPTSATLLIGVVLTLIARLAFDLTYQIPGVLSTIFLLLFMYALGLKVGPQFFTGLKSGGLAFVVIGLVVWSLNWLICVVGAKLAGLAPGAAAGLIGGSYTVTAVLGVAQSAISSGTYGLPDGLSAHQLGANMAVAFAISYVPASVGISLLIRYLPQLFGHDPVIEARRAAQDFSGETPAPGTPGSLTLGFSPLDIRAFRVEHQELVGKSIQDLFKTHRRAPILRVVREGQIIEPGTNPTLQQGDIISVRADVHGLILKAGEVVGPEVDDPTAREIKLEAADIRVGSQQIAGQTLAQLDESAGFGLQLSALFRGGQEIPIGPQTDVRFGDVLRVTGPDACIQQLAATLGGKPILDSMVTEVMYLAIAMVIGYLVGIISITIAGIPFALGTSAGCLLAGIFMSYFRSRNPEFGGPINEGARSFLQDIGLNVFAAAMAANVGPSIVDAFKDFSVVWFLLIGTTAALLPVVVAYIIGDKVFKLNPVINDGACAGARNSGPALNAIINQSGSTVAAVSFSMTYALATVLAVIGGYLAMFLA